MTEAYRDSPQGRIEPPRKIVKTYKKRHLRKKKSPAPGYNNIYNVLNLYPESSSKKKHHMSQHEIHPQPFNLYSSSRSPNDPIPEIRSKKMKSRKNTKKSKKLLKSGRKRSNVRSTSPFYGSKSSVKFHNKSSSKYYWLKLAKR
jgi:hypothetical protein